MASNKKRGKALGNTTILFVYGTLKRGQRNHGLMREARFLGEAVTAPLYTLLDLGSFPGMISEGSTAVQGELYEVGPELLTRLDRHEGVPRLYVREVVQLKNYVGASSYFLVKQTRILRGKVHFCGEWPCP